MTENGVDLTCLFSHRGSHIAASLGHPVNLKYKCVRFVLVYGTLCLSYIENATALSHIMDTKTDHFTCSLECVGNYLQRIFFHFFF